MKSFTHEKGRSEGGGREGEGGKREKEGREGGGRKKQKREDRGEVFIPTSFLLPIWYTCKHTDI